MDNLTLIEQRKIRNLKRLTERYYGKKDLLDEWELFPGVDPTYRNDLKRRVNICHNDLLYRGVHPEDIK